MNETNEPNRHNFIRPDGCTCGVAFGRRIQNIYCRVHCVSDAGDAGDDLGVTSQDRLDALLSMKDDQAPIPAELSTEPGAENGDANGEEYEYDADENIVGWKRNAPLKAMRPEDYLGSALIELDALLTLPGFSDAREAAQRTQHHIRRALDELHRERAQRKDVIRSLQGRRAGVRNSSALTSPALENEMRERDNPSGGSGSTPGQKGGSSGGSSGGSGGSGKTPRETPATEQPSGSDSPSSTPGSETESTRRSTDPNDRS